MTQQVIATAGAAAGILGTQIMNLMTSQNAADVEAAMEKMESLIPAMETINSVDELETNLKLSGSFGTPVETLEAAIYSAKKEIKSLSDVQKADIAARRQETKDRKAALQEQIKSLTTELRVAQKREQDAAKLIRQVERTQKRDAKAVEDAQKAAARQARRDAKAMENAEKAEARKAREDARAIKRQMALNSAAARTAAALAREQAAAAALAALAETKPARKTRVKKEAVETE